MSHEIQDTIIAVSSPVGRAYHAIIKISGTEAIACLKTYLLLRAFILI